MILKVGLKTHLFLYLFEILISSKMAIKPSHQNNLNLQPDIQVSLSQSVKSGLLKQWWIFNPTGSLKILLSIIKNEFKVFVTVSQIILK